MVEYITFDMHTVIMLWRRMCERERESERERAHTKCRCVVFEIDAASVADAD